MIPDELRERGACYEAIEYYPVKRSYYVYSGGGVFARRYFNAAFDEVAYVLDATGTTHIFETPRVWWDKTLLELTWVGCPNDRNDSQTDLF